MALALHGRSVSWKLVGFGRCFRNVGSSFNLNFGEFIMCGDWEEDVDVISAVKLRKMETTCISS